jgi:hypothetical protein
MVQEEGEQTKMDKRRGQKERCNVCLLMHIGDNNPKKIKLEEHVDHFFKREQVKGITFSTI